jgi:hypothetical protein
MPSHSKKSTWQGHDQAVTATPQVTQLTCGHWTSQTTTSVCHTTSDITSRTSSVQLPVPSASSRPALSKQGGKRQSQVPSASHLTNSTTAKALDHVGRRNSRKQSTSAARQLQQQSVEPSAVQVVDTNSQPTQRKWQRPLGDHPPPNDKQNSTTKPPSSHCRRSCPSVAACMRCAVTQLRPQPQQGRADSVHNISGSSNRPICHSNCV